MVFDRAILVVLRRDFIFSRRWNYPGLSPNQLIYLKGVCLFLPFIGLMFHVMTHYRDVIKKCLLVAYQNRYILLYVLFCLISIPLAVDPSYSLQRLIYMVFGLASLIALIVQFSLYASYDFFVKLITWLTVFSLAFPVYVLLRYGIQDLIPGYRTALQSYLLIHPNLLASFYAHLAVFHVGILLYSNKKKLISSICLVFLSIMIFLLFSRTVFASLCVTGFAMSLLLYGIQKKKIYLILPLLFIAIVTGATALLLTGSASAQNIFGFFTRGDNVSSLMTLTNRTELWNILLSQVTLKTALLGNGFSVVTDTFGVDFGTGILYGAHNAYLSIFLGTGIFALVTVLVYFTVQFLKIYKNRYQLPLLTSVVLLSSLMLFAFNCLTAEEMGVNMTVTFAYLLFVINVLLPAESRFEHPAHRL